MPGEKARAGDFVIAEIVGYRPSTEPWERRFVVLQAAIDDSYTDGGACVLGGYAATAESWAAFSKEWEELLPSALRGGPRNIHRFKMKEMARRLDRVPPFYRVIEKHVLLGISCKIDAGDLQRARNRIWSDNVSLFWGSFSDVYWMSVSGLLGMFHEFRLSSPAMEKLLPLDQKVDFYFDKQSDSGELIDQWDTFNENQPQAIRELYGEVPRFKDDEEFLPLQAADFWAWWVRSGYENGNLSRYEAWPAPGLDDTHLS
jgi:hypothetical protein